MATGRINADDAFDWLVEALQDVTLTSTRLDARNKLVVGSFDEYGNSIDSKSRTFGIIINAEGESAWCFGGHSLELIIRINYMDSIVMQDANDITEYLMHSVAYPSGVGGLYSAPWYTENDEQDIHKKYLNLPISIDYKPPLIP